MKRMKWKVYACNLEKQIMERDLIIRDLELKLRQLEEEE